MSAARILRVVVGAADELLAARPAEDDDDEHVAKRTFQAVMISCCAVEYATAVSFGTSQHVSSASAFVACVMPTAPGVTDATFASDPSRRPT